MTMTPSRPIPADLMDDEPIAEPDLEAFVTSAVELAQKSAADSETVTLSPEAAAMVLLALECASEDSGPEGREYLAPVIRFRVDDNRKAEWAMRKLTAVETEAAEVAELAAGWIADVNRWRADQLRPLVARRTFFEGALIAYQRERREADPKAKTLTLPSGTVKSTSASVKVGLAKDDKLALEQVIAWAEAHLEGEDLEALVKVEKSVPVMALRAVAEVKALPIALRWEGSLACGHELTFQLATDRTGKPIDVETEPPRVGQPWPCPECPPEFGEDAAPIVTELGTVEVTQDTVVDTESGDPIPGAIVEPAKVNYSVKAGG